VRPCEESARLVQEALGARLEGIVQLQQEYTRRYDAIIKASRAPAPHTIESQLTMG
jgi:hypothetical protein